VEKHLRGGSASLLGREMVGCHRDDRGRRDDALAAVEQRAREAQQVAGRGHEAAAGVREGWRDAPPAVRRRVEDDQLCFAGREARRQAAGGGDEGGVGHPQRVEQPVAEELVEGTPAGSGEDDPEHRVGQVVPPDRAGLLQQRELCEPLDPGVGAERNGGVGGTDAQPCLRGGAHRHTVGLEDEAEAEAHRQQVLHGDRALGGHRVLKGPVDPAQHTPVGQLRHEALHRIGQGKDSLLHERQRQHSHHRLGVRADPHQRVSGEGTATAEAGRARSAHRQLVVTQIADNGPRHLAGIDERTDRVQQQFSGDLASLSGRPATGPGQLAGPGLSRSPEEPPLHVARLQEGRTAG